jgi:DNA polymerase-3 subunit delta'
MEKAAHGEPGAQEKRDPAEILLRSIENDRVHSAYLLTGSGEAPLTAALAFARALVCRRGTGIACEACAGCQRSAAVEDEIAIDGKGKRGPTYRHIGDHPDLLWVERGSDDTRVTIGQIRDVQAALRLGANEGGRRCAVIADAEWLNPQAQNALLRLLEEPPPATTLVLVASRSSAIIATIRSRSVRVRFPVVQTGIRDADLPESVSDIVQTLDGLSALSVGDVLDLAENYRGARATAAEHVTELVDVAAQWLNEDVKNRIARGERPAPRDLDAYRSLQQLRRDLIQRNANPQMVAERLLLGLRDVVTG